MKWQQNGVGETNKNRSWASYTHAIPTHWQFRLPPFFVFAFTCISFSATFVKRSDRYGPLSSRGDLEISHPSLCLHPLICLRLCICASKRHVKEQHVQSQTTSDPSDDNVDRLFFFVFFISFGHPCETFSSTWPAPV